MEQFLLIGKEWFTYKVKNSWVNPSFSTGDCKYDTLFNWRALN